MKPINPPTVWSVAGSDSCGGAGLQADLKTLTHLKVLGCTVVTAITAQNTRSVTAITPCDDTLFQQQLDTLDADFPPHVIKSGMLASVGQVKRLATFLNQYPTVQYVCDPVMIATTGDQLVDPRIIEAMKTSLFPRATLLTPNYHEALVLAACSTDPPIEVDRLAQILFQQYTPDALLIKGGDRPGAIIQEDYFDKRGDHFTLQQPREHLRPIHGTGCSLAAAIAAWLALGDDIKTAIIKGHGYLQQAIRTCQFHGKGSDLLNHTFPIKAISPSTPSFSQPLFSQPSRLPATPFPPLGSSLDLYPIIDDMAWLPRLARANIQTAQLRLKHASHESLTQILPAALALAKTHQITLIINDHWQLAIEYGAAGVHLGQEDLEQADLQAIHQAGLCLGISSHNEEALSRAMAIRPTYIALGPIYPTRSKSLNIAPKGVAAIRQWRQRMADDIPLIAIGGIETSEQMAQLITAGADGIAVIRFLTHATAPIVQMQQALHTILETKQRLHSLPPEVTS